MIRNALIIAAKDMRLMTRTPAAMIGGYVMPVILLLIFGMIYTGMGDGGTGAVKIDLLYVDESADGSGADYLKGLKQVGAFQVYDEQKGENEDETVPLSRERAAELVGLGKYPVAIVFEGAKGEGNIFENPPELTLMYDKRSSLEKSITEGLIRQAFFLSSGSSLPREGMNVLFKELGIENNPLTKTILDGFDNRMAELEQLQSDNEAEDGEGGSSPSGGGGGLFGGAMNDFPRVKLDAYPKTELKKSGDDDGLMANTVAGLLSMFLLFSVAYSAGSLLEEQSSGTIRRLLLSPVKVDSIIFGKILSTGLNCTLQSLIMLIAAWLIFKVDFLTAFPTVLVMVLATVAATTSFGMILAALAKNYEAVNSMTTLIVLTMSGIGGSMFPRVFMPAWMKGLGLFTINGWAIDGFIDALYYKNGVGSVLGFGPDTFLRNSEALVLFTFAIVCGCIATAIFRRRLVRGG